MKLRPGSWLDVVLLGVVTLLTYGLLIPHLGFYRDDWYMLWTAQAGGPEAIRALFLSDRPLVGHLYALYYGWLGANPLGWHILALLARLAANLACLWIARQLWPRRRIDTLAISLLFAVYPGFVSQPNAGVYVHLLFANAAAVVSLALTVAVHRAISISTKWICTLGAIGAALFYLGIFESMIGIEAARVGLIVYLEWQRRAFDGMPKPGPVLAIAAPYLLLAVGFVYWRLFVFQSTRHATNLGFVLGDLVASPVRSGLAVLVETLKDAVETSLFAWVVPFYHFTAQAAYRDLALAASVAIAVGLLVALYLRWSDRSAPGDEAPESRELLGSIVLGIWAVVVVLLPINLAGRDVLFEGQWDRYALPASLGVALLLGGLLLREFGPPTRRIVLLSLIGMSVTAQYFSAAWYRDFWSSTRELWWQMIWRAPALQRGTMLFVPASEYAEGYEIYGPANLIYFPGEPELQIGAEVLNSETAGYLLAQKRREHYDRSTLVPDNFAQALIAVVPGEGSCLHVLDGRAVELPGLMDNTLVSTVAPRSRIEMIDVGASRSSRPAFLGSEPVHAWCFYYQQIELARQRGDWLEAARLMDEAQSKDLQPLDKSEWMPALEAYVVLDRIKDARHAASIVRVDAPTRFYLCAEWSRELPFLLADDLQTIRELICGAS